MDRRGFLASILAAGCAPAIVRADSLMRIVSRDTILLPFSDDYLAGFIRESYRSGLSLRLDLFDGIRQYTLEAGFTYGFPVSDALRQSRQELIRYARQNGIGRPKRLPALI